jgi:hypothetical protein
MVGVEEECEKMSKGFIEKSDEVVMLWYEERWALIWS